MNDVVFDQDARPQHRPNRRRLSDHVLIAFHFACDQGDFEAADKLLAIFEVMLRRPPPAERPEQRVNVEPFVAAHERLWALRHPDVRDG